MIEGPDISSPSFFLLAPGCCPFRESMPRKDLIVLPVQIWQKLDQYGMTLYPTFPCVIFGCVDTKNLMDFIKRKYSGHFFCCRPSPKRLSPAKENFLAPLPMKIFLVKP